MTQSQRILIVSDEEADRFLPAALEQRGFEVAITQDTEEAYRQLLGSDFDLAIIDLAEAVDAVDVLGTDLLHRRPSALKERQGGDRIAARLLRRRRLGEWYSHPSGSTRLL